MRKFILFIALFCLTGLSFAEDYITDLSQVIDEGNDSFVTAVFLNHNGVAQVPQSTCYYVDDEYTALRMYETCPTPAASTVTINLPPQANQIIHEESGTEPRILTVSWTHPSGCTGTACKAAQQPFRYWVVNNKKVYVGLGPTATPSSAPRYGITPLANPTPTPQ